MSKSKNPDTIRVNQWRHNNPDKAQNAAIRAAYRLLIRAGVIDGEKVLTDPTKR